MPLTGCAGGKWVFLYVRVLLCASHSVQCPLPGSGMLLECREMPPTQRCTEPSALTGAGHSPSISQASLFAVGGAPLTSPRSPLFTPKNQANGPTGASHSHTSSLAWIGSLVKTSSDVPRTFFLGKKREVNP